MNKAIIKLKDIKKSYFIGQENELEILHGINLEIYENEFIAIVGESGSGKSVTVKTIMGILDSNGSIDSGSIMYNFKDKDEYVEEGTLDDVDYQWTILADNYENTINEHFTFYTSDGMIQEQHTQHVFDPNMVISKMKNIGFDVKVYEKEDRIEINGHKGDVVNINTFSFDNIKLA